MEAGKVVPMSVRRGTAARTAGSTRRTRATVIAVVMTRMRAAWLAWRAWRREREDLRALCALDDRTLRDIGLGRDDVGALARRHDTHGADRRRA
jgi:uncharacterized protein YjiS (DUF1127 family)